MVAAAVIGAGGFSGQETLDRVLAHPTLELLALGSDSLAGQSAEALDLRLARNGHGPLPQFVSNEEALAAGAELVFCCLDNDFDGLTDCADLDCAAKTCDGGTCTLGSCR